MHLIGLTHDQPYHRSSLVEREQLYSHLQQVLARNNHRPALITLARSVEDGFTPESTAAEVS